MGNHRRQRQILTTNEVFSGKLVSVTLLLLLLVLEFVVEGEDSDGTKDEDGGVHEQVSSANADQS